MIVHLEQLSSEVNIRSLMRILFLELQALPSSEGKRSEFETSRFALCANENSTYVAAKSI